MFNKFVFCDAKYLDLIVSRLVSYDVEIITAALLMQSMNFVENHIGLLHVSPPTQPIQPSFYI